jgi:hypothetical protein
MLDADTLLPPLLDRIYAALTTLTEVHQACILLLISHACVLLLI